MELQVWILLCLSVQFVANEQFEYQQCVSNIHTDFELCHPRKLQSITARTCQKDIQLCKRGFNISYRSIEPFSQNKFKKMIEQVFSHCCGSCGNINVLSDNLTDLSYTSTNSSHIVYPVIALKMTKKLHGFFFLPFWEDVGSFYITKKPSKKEIVMFLLKAVLNLWPLLVVMLLLCMVSAFIVWALEKEQNDTEFSKSFLEGLADGFWWSFISITTVGYGDKTPKRFISRFLSVIWILAGMTIFSIFTATIAVEVITKFEEPKGDMMGKTVGVVKDRVINTVIAAKHGGVVEQSQNTNLILGVIELIDKLKNNDIDGIVLDKYSYMYVSFILDEVSKYREYRQYFLTKTFQTEKTYDCGLLSVGLLIKERNDYEFIKGFFDDNHLHIETCINIAVNRFQRKNITDIDNEFSMLDPEGGLLVPIVVVTSSLLLISLCTGSFYELRRNKENKPKGTKRKVDSNDNIDNSLFGNSDL